MRTYLLSLFILVLFSCNASQENQQEVQSDTKAYPVKTANNFVVKDTTPKPKSNRVVNSSRSQNEVSQTYPYDIDLKTKDGEIFNSKNVFESNGKPTILLFWLTTCYPCRIEMAAIEKEFAGWKKEVDFNIYAISTDFEKNFSKFEKMVEENNWP